MTNVVIALAALEAAQDAASPIMRDLNFARNALKRSKSAKNIAAYIAADEAATVAIETCEKAHAAVEVAKMLDAVEAAKEAKIAEDAAQPAFAF